MRQIRITLPQKKIGDFCLKWKISEMALFGSVLSDEFHPDSDIDVLVEFHHGADLFDFVGLSQFLEERLSRKVDVVPLSSLREEVKPYVLREAVYL